MSDLPVRIVLVLLWSAVVSLDERAFGSFLFHQPLVAASLAGAIMGDARGGMVAGLVFQALWPALFPIGGNLLPAVGPASVLAGAVAGWGARAGSGAHPGWASGGAGFGSLPAAEGILVLAVVLGLAAAWAGRLWERGTRARNEAREALALASRAPLDRALGRALALSYADTALRGIAVAGAGLAVALLVLTRPETGRALANDAAVRLGRALPLAAVALGLGGLLLLLRGTRVRQGGAILWGLLAGIAIQLLRGL